MASELLTESNEVHVYPLFDPFRLLYQVFKPRVLPSSKLKDQSDLVKERVTAWSANQTASGTQMLQVKGQTGQEKRSQWEICF